MSANKDVRQALIEMGVDGPKATEAATRYNSVEAALNWVFGEGENWSWADIQVPTTEPSYDFNGQNWPDDWENPSPQPPTTFGSNNPFRNNAGATGANRPPPPPPPPRPQIQHDEEEELRRALELSKQTDDGRGERERSVRASAPPPSPGRIIGPDEVIAFGPSNKSDPEGKLAVSIVPPTVNAQIESNKEEEDFQRAIQESMMTASFHSVASVHEKNIPSPQERVPGVPVVFLTSEQPTFAAHIMQALAAVPQLRDVFAHIKVDNQDPSELVALHGAFQAQANETNNYTLIDDCVRTLHQEWDIRSSSLPPHMPILEKWIPHFSAHLTDAAEVRENLILMDDHLADFYNRPKQLMITHLHSAPQAAHNFVNFDRSLSSPTTVHDSLASIIWTPENPGESVEQLSDILFVALRRTPGVAAAKWELDEEVVLDRYLTPNAAWAAQIRGKQSVVQGELRRLIEQIEHLTTFKSNSVPDALQTLIKHLETDPATIDPEKSAMRSALKEKLERIDGLMKAKLAKLQDAIVANQAEASGGLFETTDPTKNQHKYLLRAILWHDGFLTPGKHLYAYVRSDDSWFRVQDEVAAPATWDEVQADTTGQFTDGGPYLLVYSRDGPRPADSGPSSPVGGGAAVQHGERHINFMDVEIEMDDDTTVGASSAPPTSTSSVFDPSDELPPATPMAAHLAQQQQHYQQQREQQQRTRTPSPSKAGGVRGPRPLVKSTSCASESGTMTAATATEPAAPLVAALSTSPAKMPSPLMSSPLMPAPGPVPEPELERNEKRDADNDLIM